MVWGARRKASWSSCTVEQKYTRHSRSYQSFWGFPLALLLPLVAHSSLFLAKCPMGLSWAAHICPVQGWLCGLGEHRRRTGIPSSGQGPGHIWRKASREDSGQQAGGWAGAEGPCPEGPVPVRVPRLPAVQSHLGPSPCGYCCRKRPPGQQSPCWVEGGWRLAGASTRNVCPGM